MTVEAICKIFNALARICDGLAIELFRSYDDYHLTKSGHNYILSFGSFIFHPDIFCLTCPDTLATALQNALLNVFGREAARRYRKNSFIVVGIKISKIPAGLIFNEEMQKSLHNQIFEQINGFFAERTLIFSENLRISSQKTDKTEEDVEEIIRKQISKFKKEFSSKESYKEKNDILKEFAQFYKQLYHKSNCELLIELISTEAKRQERQRLMVSDSRFTSEFFRTPRETRQSRIRHVTAHAVLQVI